jgi:DNA-binding PadR family transcriptional regulator
MSLSYAILGFLQYQPLSGYDLKKIFDRSVRHFWSADQSQIYRTLAHLTQQGWVEVEVIEQSDRPDRKLYHITPAGQAALRSWLEGPFPVQESRSAPLIQVFFMAGLSDERILEKFREAEALFRAMLTRYEQVPNQIDDMIQMAGSQRETYFWMQTLELGNKVMRVQLEWAQAIIETMEKGKLPLRGEAERLEGVR